MVSIVRDRHAFTDRKASQFRNEARIDRPLDQFGASGLRGQYSDLIEIQSWASASVSKSPIWESGPFPVLTATNQRPPLLISGAKKEKSRHSRCPQYVSYFSRRTSLNLLAAFFFLASFFTPGTRRPSCGPSGRAAQLCLDLRALLHRALPRIIAYRFVDRHGDLPCCCPPLEPCRFPTGQH